MPKESVRRSSRLAKLTQVMEVFIDNASPKPSPSRKISRATIKMETDDTQHLQTLHPRRSTRRKASSTLPPSAPAPLLAAAPILAPSSAAPTSIGASPRTRRVKLTVRPPKPDGDRIATSVPPSPSSSNTSNSSNTSGASKPPSTPRRVRLIVRPPSASAVPALSNSFSSSSSASASSSRLSDSGASTSPVSTPKSSPRVKHLRLRVYDPSATLEFGHARDDAQVADAGEMEPEREVEAEMGKGKGKAVWIGKGGKGKGLWVPPRSADVDMDVDEERANGEEGAVQTEGLCSMCASWRACLREGAYGMWAPEEDCEQCRAQNTATSVAPLSQPRSRSRSVSGEQMEENAPLDHAMVLGAEGDAGVDSGMVVAEEAVGGAYNPMLDMLDTFSCSSSYSSIDENAELSYPESDSYDAAAPSNTPVSGLDMEQLELVNYGGLLAVAEWVQSVQAQEQQEEHGGVEQVAQWA